MGVLAMLRGSDGGSVPDLLRRLGTVQGPDLRRSARRGPRPGRRAVVGLLDRAREARPQGCAVLRPDRGAAIPGRATARWHRGRPELRGRARRRVRLRAGPGDPPRPDPWPPGPAPVLPGPHRNQGLLRDARGVGLPGYGGRPQLDVPRARCECKPGPWLRPPLGAVFMLGYLNAKAPAPDPSAPVVGTG